jgi:hypothetical protein
MQETPKVTKAYRTSQKLSLRGFADAVNEKLINTGVSHTHVGRMEQDANYYEPDPKLLFECLVTYQDWRAEWARDCFISMYPDLFMRGIVDVKLPKAE